MQGDFDRISFNAQDRFASVLLQQGRLLLPSEFNAQSAIHHHFLRAFIKDFVGRAWRPQGQFTISTDGTSTLRLMIGKGHFYVDGILCENHVECSYAKQPFAPTGQDAEEVEDLDGTEGALYIDCWERHVTWLQQASLREPALGGPDTTTRVQIAWQVRVLAKPGVADHLGLIKDAYGARLKVATTTEEKTAITDRITALGNLIDGFDGLTCPNVAKVIDALDDARPRMVADAKRDDEQPDPCAIAAESEYRGRENQLYRVEIHRSGLEGKATFKWSRENGAVAFKVLHVETENPADPAKATTRLLLESLGRDRRTGLCVGDWVELSDDDSEFAWQALPLLRVLSIDPQRRAVTLQGALAPLVSPAKHAIARRWDHKGDPDAGGAIPVSESPDDIGWIELERGVRVRFLPGGLCRRGDYWLVAARAITGDVDWPMDGKARRPLEPMGIVHHRASLGIVTKVSEKWGVSKECACEVKPKCP